MAEQSFILSNAHGLLAKQLGSAMPHCARNTSQVTAYALAAAAADLDVLGFLGTNVDGGPSERCWSDQTNTDRKLLGLLHDFDLSVEIARGPDGHTWIAAAPCSPEPNAPDANPHEATVFSGVGFDPKDAARRCLGEAAEFLSWLGRPSDSGSLEWEPGRTDTEIDAFSILGFSRRQIENRQAFNRQWAGYDAIPSSDCFQGTLAWASAARLHDGAPFWVPAQLCFGRFARSWRNDSNGCAASSSREDALVRAICELIERDATGIWWYGQCRRPAIDVDALDVDAPDVRHLAVAMQDRKRWGQHAWLLDLTHDLGLPVAAAVAFSRSGALLGLGFGCHLEMSRAACAAYREMCQMEISLSAAAARCNDEDDAHASEVVRLVRWHSAITLDRCDHLTPKGTSEAAHTCSPINADGRLSYLLDRLRTAGLTAYGVDLHRPDIGIPVVRVFIPGLCHFKPRLGQPRLVDVPRKLGWRGADFTAESLSRVPLLI